MLEDFFRRWILGAARALGSEIRDCRTGEPLGRGFLLPWRGRIILVGLEASVMMVPLPRKRITYWGQDIGFTRHPEPDFPRTEPALSLLKNDAAKDPRVLLVLLDHRAPAEVAAAAGRWTTHGFAMEDILVAYGGGESAFGGLDVPNRLLITGSRLRTRDHTREAQSYREVFSAVTRWLSGRPHTHVLFVEYDHIPICDQPAAQFLDRLDREDADVLGHWLTRIDGTTNPHWLAAPTQTLRRPEVLSLLGTGHFWKRAAWEAVAADSTLASWYLELDLPTTAHGLGFRVRNLPDQNRFVMNLPERLECTREQARQLGAWTLHPVK